MTQAYNLSQLANNLNTSGQLDATDGLVNAVPIANGGTGATSASGARANLDVAQAVYAVPSGGIIIWSGSVAAVPTGWFLCNGSNGTPDLRNRFIAGAGSTYAVGATGGSADASLPSHTHAATITDSGHRHFVAAGVDTPAVYPNYTVTSTNQMAAGNGGTGGFERYVLSGVDNEANVSRTSPTTTGISVSNATQGVSPTNANLPPYYALCYIMKS